MKITYRGYSKQVKLAVEDANDVLNSPEFYELIERNTAFNCTQLTPQEISTILKNSNLEVEVNTYKPPWRFSKVLGYFSPKKPNNIFLNGRKIYRSTNSISNTIVHEYTHAVDFNFNNGEFKFGHSCGTFKNTAPYVIGNLAEIIIDGKDLSDIDASLLSFSSFEGLQCHQNEMNSFVEDDFIIQDLRIID